jgi:hypothetical protein
VRAISARIAIPEAFLLDMLLAPPHMICYCYDQDDPGQAQDDTEGWAMWQARRGKRDRRAMRMRVQAALARQAAHEERHAVARRPSRWQSVRPWFVAALVIFGMGLAVLIGSIFVLGHGNAVMATSLIPVGALLLVTSAAPLIFGLMKLVEISGPEHHCGRCAFYHPSPEGYTRGICVVDGGQAPTTSDNGCGRYAFSERAMVRERLNAAPHILDSPAQR